MKSTIIGLVMCFLTMNNFAEKPFAQSNDSTVNRTDSLKKQQHKTLNTYIGYGFSKCVGPENGVILFPSKISYSIYHEKSTYEIYYGLDAAVFLLMAFEVSGSVFGGIKRKNFTFDTSLSYLYFPKQETFDGPAEMYEHVRLNPKIGFNYKWFWIKTGPSINLYQNRTGLFSYSNNLTELRSFNFEIGLHWLYDLESNKRYRLFKKKKKN
jgi:hypothetical protein